MINKTTGALYGIQDDGINYLLDQWVVPPDDLPKVMELMQTFQGQA